ncbi:hypothetical protein GCM10010924_52430 [Rhizobium wenxiniae]|nr:hypothetical protein GCM10010924_52430 [Rhizobium wenxiniae]
MRSDTGIFDEGGEEYENRHHHRVAQHQHIGSGKLRADEDGCQNGSGAEQASDSNAVLAQEIRQRSLFPLIVFYSLRPPGQGKQCGNREVWNPVRRAVLLREYITPV